MYKSKEIIDDDKINRRIWCESEARYRFATVNYHFNCAKCENQVIGDESGTFYDCNNCRLTEDEKDYEVINGKYHPKNKKSKVYCLNYRREL